MILRRLYLYLVSAAGLGLLAAGLALLGSTVLLFAFNDPSAQASRTQLAIYTAMTVVALPVWGAHFWFARRFAMRDAAERASAIRRMYLYWACLAASIGGHPSPSACRPCSARSWRGGASSPFPSSSSGVAGCCASSTAMAVASAYATSCTGVAPAS